MYELHRLASLGICKTKHSAFQHGLFLWQISKLTNEEKIQKTQHEKHASCSLKLYPLDHNVLTAKQSFQK